MRGWPLFCVLGIATCGPTPETSQNEAEASRAVTRSAEILNSAAQASKPARTDNTETRPTAAAVAGGWDGHFSTHEPQLVSNTMSDNYLTINRMSGGGYRVTFEVAAASCLGDVDFRIPKLPSGNQMVVSTEDDEGNVCVMRMRKDGNTIIASETGCEAFHGMQCSFSGAYRRE